MESAQVRIRPFRLAFLVEPRDRKALQRVFEMNSSLWGGVFNYIIPLFKTVPPRYKQEYQKTISAKRMINGFIEAFQPDYVVETQDGQIREYGVNFPEKRSTSFAELLARDEQNRCQIGIDLRSVCHDMYVEQFQFVQRHGPEVVIPTCNDSRYALLFSAMFGAFPEKSDLAQVYLNALDGKHKEYEALEYPDIFDTRKLFPLRVTRHKLETFRNSHSWQSHLFYMDESSGWDLIEYWNYRALGWPIVPLPARLAPQLKDFCEKFIVDHHRPFPPPSNAWYATSLLCAKSQSFEDMQAFVRTLKIPNDNHPLSIDPRVPRLWEEWGRGADHATPQTVTHAQKSTNAYVIGNGLDISFQPHEFAESDPYCSRYLASANVIESIGSDTPVIPWNRNVATKLTYNFGQEKTWISREGIVTFGGTYASTEDLRMPSPINIFGALAEASGFQLSLSPAGRVCEQITASFGSLMAARTILESKDLLRMLDRMAHEDLEVEIEEPAGGPEKRKKVKKAYAPLGEVQRVLRMSNQADASRLDRHLAALTRCNVLRLGMALKCDSCLNTSWFSLEDLRQTLNCPRCLTEFSFPGGMPPSNAWAYRVLGPFATSNFAHGAYCVAAAMHFIEKRVAHKTTMIPSFEMKKNGQSEFEADFGAFITMGAFSQITTPYLILGECKSFNRFEDKDFERARRAGELFPGAILCFCTFNESLGPSEIKGLKKIVEAGRESLDVGMSVNPVLILTARELFGQFHFGEFSKVYGTDSQMARGMFMRGEIREVCEFTQRLYLGMP
ncbi:MAG: hypothetical protein ABR910_17965, partial [Acidobacteriaceae bacterium]